MPICVPVKDMRDTASFLKLVKGSAQPVVVTKNGYDECVVMTSEEYDYLVAAEERSRLYLSLLEAEVKSVRTGDQPASSVISELRARYAEA